MSAVVHMHAHREPGQKQGERAQAPPLAGAFALVRDPGHAAAVSALLLPPLSNTHTLCCGSREKHQQGEHAISRGEWRVISPVMRPTQHHAAGYLLRKGYICPTSCGNNARREERLLCTMNSGG